MFPSDLPVAILNPHVKSATPINRLNVGARNYALLFFGCVLFHIAATRSLPLIDRDEPRFAEASREMIERGDYIVPRFNNQLRLDKPPLAYWAQVTSYRVFGQNDFAARFPSALAAALTAVVIFAWGSQIGESKVGWWAAIIFTLSLQTFIHAKAAVADMWLVLFVTLAHWAGYELLRDSLTNSDHRTSNIIHRTFFWWWVFYLSLAFGFLAKGPIGWVPLLTILSTKIFLAEPKLSYRFQFLFGSLFMLAIVALWGIPALVRTHGQFFVVGIGRHVVGRSFASMEGHGANSFGIYLLLLPFYFVTIFIGFFPWSIKLPWLIGKLRRKREAAIAPQTRGYSARDEIDSYLIAGVAIIFIIFTLVKTKLPHYTLPAFPMLALLLARRFAAENATHFLRNCALASASAYLAIAIVVPPFVAQFFPAYQLFQEAREYLRPDMEFGAVDFNEPSLVWYFRGRISGFLAPLNSSRVVDFMAKAGPRFVIVPTSLTTTLFADHPENWKMLSTRGFNIAKGKRVDLTLVLKPE
jgi:4-amino-4-deoxy-L-arabinose transferase-like glycosyltransferase